MLITLSNGSTTPLSSSSASFQPIPDVSVGLEEHDGVLRDAENPAMSGLVESSQESSGFFSEDSEENKGPLALRKLDAQAEFNSSLDADSLIGMISFISVSVFRCYVFLYFVYLFFLFPFIYYSILFYIILF